ncbi:MAG TPA: hypothetical protein VJK03_02710 [Candidatus Nanoarchaeia archaeon]|nr:hypothetical protein [Candidatus Nanoarchaeia archaeon]
MNRKDIKRLALDHLVSSTAMLAASQPFFAFADNILVKLPYSVSINNRFLSVGTTLVGLGIAVTKLREKSQNYFEIDTSKRNSRLTAHDLLYGATISAVLAPIFYSIAGGQNLAELVYTTAAAIGINAAISPLNFYTVDVFRDYAGIKQTEYLPPSLKNIRHSTKKYFLGLTATASFTIVSGLYALR